MKNFFLSLLLFTQLQASEYQDVVNKLDLESDEMLLLGKEIYHETCISCHGAHGETNQAIELIVKPRRLKDSILKVDQFFSVIKEGAHHYGAHADIMPTFKYVYDDEKIASVAYYVSETFHKKRAQEIQKLIKKVAPITADKEQKMLQVGKHIFEKKCAKCHGVLGDAKSLYIEQSKADKNFIYPYDLTKLLLDEKQLFLYAKFGGEFWGSDTSDMPAWKRKYSDYQLQSVARYITIHIKNKESTNEY